MEKQSVPIWHTFGHFTPEYPMNIPVKISLSERFRGGTDKQICAWFGLWWPDGELALTEVRNSYIQSYTDAQNTWISSSPFTCHSIAGIWSGNRFNMRPQVAVSRILASTEMLHLSASGQSSFHIILAKKKIPGQCVQCSPLSDLPHWPFFNIPKCLGNLHIAQNLGHFKIATNLSISTLPRWF